jgi:hypothetical protein
MKRRKLDSDSGDLTFDDDDNAAVQSMQNTDIGIEDDSDGLN